MKNLIKIIAFVFMQITLNAVNYYSTESGDFNSIIWMEINSNTDTFYTIISNSNIDPDIDSVFVNHRITVNEKAINLSGSTIIYIANNVRVEIGKNIIMSGNSKIIVYGELVMNAHLNMYGESSICEFGKINYLGHICIYDDAFICNHEIVRISHIESKLQNNKVHINWITDNLCDNVEFVIEKSSNAIEFEAIGSSKDLEYNHTFISSIEFENSCIYYRIKTIQDNMINVYSDITTLHIGNIPELIAYPNPVISFINIICPPRSSIKELNIFDSNGVIVYNSTIYPSKTYDLYEINCHGWKSGLYYATLDNNSKTNLKFFVINN
jgi:hypothetical protein